MRVGIPATPRRPNFIDGEQIQDRGRPAPPLVDTWTVEEVRSFEERHPVGSKVRLAPALLLWLGRRF